MKALFFILFSFFCLTSCKKKEIPTAENAVIISERLSYKNDGKQFVLKSGKFENSFNSSKLGFKKVVLLNSSLLGFFTELNLVDRIVGLSSPEYVFDENIRKSVASNKIANIGNEQKYDVERILSLKPDAIFTNYVPSFENTYEILRKTNIQIIFLDEYLETTPLNKSKYLLLFGELFGVKDLAEQKYKSIETGYQYLKQLALKSAEKPVVLCNEMYGSQWFLPGGKSAAANYFRDANANYILAENTEINAIPLSFEEVYKKSENAKYWVNIGAYQTKQAMLNINPNYSKMKVFQNGKLYMINNREVGMANDYFQSGAVRADLVLKDYIKIFHPELFPKENLYYLKELK
ncbi:ABC transporter substrate-binding protein [Soonwooa sp.]|uniref:ABC transporter substrate-binding protein n=1 Tax=Soonwooa sp. TaxID=1938592 RepID=UPI0028B0334B|nr:ABC transporter substrate-binding protein [Soonwooa sp.]